MIDETKQDVYFEASKWNKEQNSLAIQRKKSTEMMRCPLMSHNKKLNNSSS